MFNCEPFLSTCKACCCGIIPIERELYDRNLEKIVTPPLYIEDLYDVDPFEPDVKKHFVFAITNNEKCCFLNSDCKCAIYSDRPKVCKIFGDESVEILTCYWQDKIGKKRSRQNKRYLERKCQKYLIRLIDIRNDTN